MTRRRTCANCGAVTIELTKAEYDELRRPKPAPVKERKPRRRPAAPVPAGAKLTKRARLFLSRGVDVPPQLERDWKTLKHSGMSSQEAAASLGLHFMHPTDRARR